MLYPQFRDSRLEYLLLCTKILKSRRPMSRRPCAYNNWARARKEKKGLCASEDSDQPAHLRSHWSESSRCAQWVAKDPRFLHADSEDSDQTDRMPRLISLRWAHRWFFFMQRLIIITFSNKFSGLNSLSAKTCRISLAAVEFARATCSSVVSEILYVFISLNLSCLKDFGRPPFCVWYFLRKLSSLMVNGLITSGVFSTTGTGTDETREFPRKSKQSINNANVLRIQNVHKYTFCFFLKKKWAVSWQNQQNDCAPSEDSDQPGHAPSLIRVFAVRSMGSWGHKLSSCGQRTLIWLGGFPG